MMYMAIRIQSVNSVLKHHTLLDVEHLWTFRSAMDASDPARDKCNLDSCLHQSSSRSLSKLSPLFRLSRLKRFMLSVLVRLIASMLLRTALLCGGEAKLEDSLWGTGHRFLAPTMLPCHMACNSVINSQSRKRSTHTLLEYASLKQSWAVRAGAPSVDDVQAQASFQLIVALHINNNGTAVCNTQLDWQAPTAELNLHRWTQPAHEADRQCGMKPAVFQG